MERWRQATGQASPSPPFSTQSLSRAVAVSGLAGGLSEPTASGSGGRAAACSKARGSMLQLIHRCKASFVLAKYPDWVNTSFLGRSNTQGMCL
jgi:hypothetical protein